MEEVGAQVAAAPPIFIHHHHHHHNRFYEPPTATATAAAHPQPPSSPFINSRKRDFSYHQQQQQYHHHHLQQQQQQLMFQDNNNNNNNNWNPKAWEWDSSRFVAKPVVVDPSTLRSNNPNSATPPAAAAVVNRDGDDRLRLNLGSAFNHSASSSPEDSSVPPQPPRSSKRVRSGSPSAAAAAANAHTHAPSYPMCQVDDCKENLSNAKDYHRRHKVCELHSKSTKALVANQPQRFCQQCSRFHPLSEFDEGKRSCRRRLAGHNRRRRKTQPEDVTSRLAHPGNRNGTSNGNLDIINLLTAFARAQGKIEDKNNNGISISDKDQLVQILSKINSLPFPMDLVAKLPNIGSLNGKLTEKPLELGNKLNVDMSSSSTMDLLAVLSATLAATTPKSQTTLSCQSSQSTESEKTSLTHLEGAADLSLQNRPPLEFPSVTGARSSTSYQSHNDDSDCQVRETQGDLQLQLFSSSPETDGPPKLDPAKKYFSSGSSNPIEEGSPSRSPPVVRNLFPLERSSEVQKSESMSISGSAKANIEDNRVPLELFTSSNLGPNLDCSQINSCQNGYYSSGSDHSPSSWNADLQDRTGRIMFKLFDKDPSHFPRSLRTQIYNWLSNSPLEMESYIRPGCVVLSVYASMSSTAWAQLETNLFQCVKSLVQDSDSDFWRSGRFLVHTRKQLASHKEGNIRIYKSWKAWSSPELISVSPLAIVSGKETSLLLRGRNLTTPGTKIHLAYMGGYASKEVVGSSHHSNMHDEITLAGVKFYNGPSGMLGRCFVEVENGFKGNSFPLIVADATICEELRLLEPVFEEEVKACDVISEDCAPDIGCTRLREEVLHYLNEIGWLFQRKRKSCVNDCTDYSLNRFKFVLAFSVERDYCALVKTILDMLVQSNLEGEKLSRESMDMLSEVQLLNRAVKRRCCKMLDLLIHYYVIGNDVASKIYLFPPNIAGPGGVTPLHLAAATSGCDDLVDSLTNDPQKIGLDCWSSLLDAAGQSPYAYAVMRDNHSYNSLVARKRADNSNGQVSVMVNNEIEQAHIPAIQHKRTLQTCAKCAVVSTKYSRRLSGPRSWLHRPYITSILAVAAVCVCVCLFFRGSPDIGLVGPFKWENLEFGSL